MVLAYGAVGTDSMPIAVEIRIMAFGAVGTLSFMINFNNTAASLFLPIYQKTVD